jgi:DNA-binding MarR family transcriptional regulator
MNYQLVTFAEARQPEYREKKGEGYIQYGEKNDYPQYLIDLFNKSAKHNAIVKSKVHYICGNGWIGNQEFINKVNRTETLNDVTKKVSTDIELFGGAYLEIIWGIDTIAEIWHIDYSKIRTNKDNTQFWYKTDWKDRNEVARIYNAFNPKFTEGKQIYYIKEYRPNIGAYSLPSYFGALNYIESDIEVSKHVLGNAKTGFSASKLITLPNGEPSPDEQRQVSKQFKDTYTGADGIKYMLSFVTDATRKPIVDDLGASDLTNEDFSNVDSLIQVNIFSGHQITTPSIFGIAQAGTLGSRSEMQDGYEIFKNTYVNAKQQSLESTFNMLCGFAGYPEDLKIVPTEPIGLSLSEATLNLIMTKDELREKIGLPQAIVKTTSTNQDVIDAINTLSPLVANKVLNNLTPNELRALINLPNAIGGSSITPDTQTFSEDYNIFTEFGDEKENYNIWKQKSIFEEINFAEVNQLQANVLDLISKQKLVTPEVIAEVLGEDVATIKRVIKGFEEKGYLKITEKKIGAGIDSNIEITRTLTEPLKNIIEKIKPITTEFLIRYSYEWKAGFNDSDIESSRPFCKFLLRANKMYSRSEIEQMSARLGYSVWDRRGGWWTQPNGNHSPSCRHNWQTNIVTRK